MPDSAWKVFSVSVAEGSRGLLDAAAVGGLVPEEEGFLRGRRGREYLVVMRVDG